MRCPECDGTMDTRPGYVNKSYECEGCGYVMPLGAD